VTWSKLRTTWTELRVIHSKLRVIRIKIQTIRAEIRTIHTEVWMTRTEVRAILYPAGVSTEKSSDGPSPNHGSEAGVRKSSR